MNVLVTTHGSLCKGLLESYEMIAGTNLAIHTLSLTDEGIETYSNQLKVLVDKLIKEGQLLIMTDIKGVHHLMSVIPLRWRIRQLFRL